MVVTEGLAQAIFSGLHNNSAAIELSSLLRSMGTVRYINPSGAGDMGARINAEFAFIESMGPNGGKVVLPYGSHDFSTSIDFGNRDNICLQGFGMPTRNTNQLDGRLYLGTELHYTGTGAGILLGPSSNGGGAIGQQLCSNCRLENFQLRFDATADYGVRARTYAVQCYMRDLSIRGTGNSGTGFYTPGTGNHSWQFSNAQFRQCAIGADINGAHNYNFDGGCAFNSNVIGMRISNEAVSANVNFHGCDAENNTDVCYEIIDGSSINFFGGYSELGANADYLVFRIGATAGKTPDSVNLYGYYVHAKATADYIMELIRVSGLTVADCYFTGTGWSYAINNAGNGVANIELRNNRITAAKALINDMTGVNFITDNAGGIHYPNLATSDPGVDGQAYRTDGDLRVSYGN